MIQHSRFNFTEKKELCVLPVIVFHRAGSSVKPTMSLYISKDKNICRAVRFLRHRWYDLSM